MNEYIYKQIINRLLRGWQPNYFRGDMQHEWWHNPTGKIEEMSDAEFSIVSDVEDEIRADIRLNMDID